MRGRQIRKSFSFESEPILHWPNAPTTVLRLKGYSLNYKSLDAMTYSIRSKKAGCIEMIKWDPKKISGWTNMFSDLQLQPSGLLRLARLGESPTAEKVCEWVSTNGPLGFQLAPNLVRPHGKYIPQYAAMGQLIPHWEPIDCIRSAARRADKCC